MVALAVLVASVVIAVVLFLFVRHGGPTRSVAHVLYDVEHPSRDQR